MDAATFTNVLQSYAHRRPFQPFTVELVSGTRFAVDHPESLVYRDGVAIYVAPGGRPTIFDHQGVAGFFGAVPDAVG